MSEIFDPKQEQVNPQGQTLNADAHSGKMPVGQGGERSVENHDHPLAEDILEIPESPSILAPNPVEAPIPDHTNNSKKLRTIVGAVVLAGAALAAGLFLGKNGDDNREQDTRVETTTPGEDNNESTDIPEVTVTTSETVVPTTEVTQTPASPEVLLPTDITPIFATENAGAEDVFSSFLVAFETLQNGTLSEDPTERNAVFNMVIAEQNTSNRDLITARSKEISQLRYDYPEENVYFTHNVERIINDEGSIDSTYQFVAQRRETGPQDYSIFEGKYTFELVLLPGIDEREAWVLSSIQEDLVETIPLEQ